ncbi:MAG: rRNA maturation RNase YbeY [Candidatus Margulisiibacteriota bacterium]
MEKWIKNLVNKILKREKVKGKIDVSLVNDQKIRELNRNFRKKDKPTNVLSFSYGPGEIIGDVVISKDTAKREAKRLGISYREEIKRLIIHGVLHILGYDHGKKMSYAEEVYQKF